MTINTLSSEIDGIMLTKLVAAIMVFSVFNYTLDTPVRLIDVLEHGNGV